MQNDSSNLFEQLDRVIEAIEDARSDDERRVYFRTALRGISHAMKKTIERLDALKKAVR